MSRTHSNSHVHVWRTTTADNYRLCSSCGLIERFASQCWVHVSTAAGSHMSHKAAWETKKTSYIDQRKASANLAGYWG